MTKFNDRLKDTLDEWFELKGEMTQKEYKLIKKTLWAGMS